MTRYCSDQELVYFRQHPDQLDKTIAKLAARNVRYGDISSNSVEAMIWILSILLATSLLLLPLSALIFPLFFVTAGIFAAALITTGICLIIKAIFDHKLEKNCNTLIELKEFKKFIETTPANPAAPVVISFPGRPSSQIKHQLGTRAPTFFAEAPASNEPAEQSPAPECAPKGCHLIQ